MQKIHGGLIVTLTATFDDSVSAVREALKAEGFGVLTEIDVCATLKEKLGVEMPRHVILGACNPPLAHAAIQADADISLLLPCNVTVREDRGRVLVSIVDPAMMAAMSKAPELKEIAASARGKLENVIAALASP
ncbi:MAG TPA: DUF302 domain-containing protein [Dehalococcoidia bacterium]|nr:DUF302 domain-containing protein [Dehalococcoidia bacterium]